MNDNETIQIHLNSKYATSYNNNSSSDCNFTLPNIEVQDGYYIHLSIINCVIPYSFYNIDKTNNGLFYQEIQVDANGNQTGTINTTLYFNSGNYNAIQLATYLTQNLPRTTVTYNTINGKYTFVNTTYNFIIRAQFCTCLNILGCSTNDLYNTSVLKSLTCYSPANLSPRQCICVSSNLTTGNINNQLDGNRSIICSIPILSTPYSIINYTSSNNSKFNLYSSFFNFINLKLTDQNGVLIDLNNQHWTIILQLDIIKFLDS